MAPNDILQCELIRCRACGASPIADEIVPLLELSTTGPSPDDLSPSDYSAAAHVIADALWATLAQGMLDALFAEFARRKASTLSIRYPEQSNATPPT